MPDPASPAESIERFAELIALEDDGYTPRRAILLAAGVLAPEWREIERGWMERLAAGDDPDLAVRFGKTYGLTRLSFSNATVPEETPAAGLAEGDVEPAPACPVPPRFDTHDTLVDGAPPIAALLAVDRVDLAADHASEGLNDIGEGGAPLQPLDDPLQPVPRDPADGTLICPLGAVPREPLPFVPPVVPPGKRLAFYDTQTGARLPQPVLVDAPVSGDG
jgi:hypothetical protein